MVKLLQTIVCLHCRRTLKLISPYNTASDGMEWSQTGIFCCACREYPLINGILYLRDDSARTKALDYLKYKKYTRAIISLLGVRRLLLLPIYLLTPISPLDSIVYHIFHKHIYALLRLPALLGLFCLFSYSRSWVWYVINTKRLPSYFLSLFASNLITNKKSYVVDVGCGVGQLLPTLVRKSNAENVVGIDKSFMNLMFARLYFAHKKTLLLCVDVENGLPFLDSSIHTILATDSFHYISHKSLFIKEASRILHKSGSMAIVHTSRIKNKNSNEKGISPHVMKRLLRESGFGKASLLSNYSLWKKMVTNETLEVGMSDSRHVLDSNWIYSVIVRKNSKPLSLCLTKREIKLLTSTNIDFGLDVSLQMGIQLDKIRNNYDAIFFISPHFDDAVLSCGALIKELGITNKTVVTVFTKPSPPPYTPTAIEFVKKCGYADPEKLFQERRQEDIQAMRHLSCRYIHLDFVDAAWRKSLHFITYPLLQPVFKKIPYFVHTYRSSHQQFSGHISRQDKRLEEEICRVFTAILPRNKRVLLFAPLGIGGHADHIITRCCVEKLDMPTIFWQDAPYNVSSQNVKRFFSQNKYYKPFLNIPDSIGDKTAAITFYKSQVPVLFPDRRIPNLPETYYLPH